MIMTNKTALITGGASGIGKASAIAFANEGANVFILDIDVTGMNAVVDEITTFGGKAFAHKADVSKEHEVSEAITCCVELFGSIDYAHNNAAVINSKSTVACTEEIWDKTMNTNLKGYWLCMIRASSNAKAGIRKYRQYLVYQRSHRTCRRYAVQCQQVRYYRLDQNRCVGKRR